VDGNEGLQRKDLLDDQAQNSQNSPSTKNNKSNDATSTHENGGKHVGGELNYYDGGNFESSGFRKVKKYPSITQVN